MDHLRKKGFKPTFIRLSYLLLTQGAFCFCIVLIEYLLSLTATTDISAGTTTVNTASGERKRDVDEGYNDRFKVYPASGSFGKLSTHSTSWALTVFDPITVGHNTELDPPSTTVLLQHEQSVALRGVSPPHFDAHSGTKATSIGNLADDIWVMPQSLSKSPRDLAIAASNTSTITCIRSCTLGKTTTIIERTTTTSTVWSSTIGTKSQGWQVWTTDIVQPSVCEPQLLQRRDEWSTFFDEATTNTMIATVTNLDGGVVEQESIIVAGRPLCQQNCPTTIVPGVSTVTESTTITIGEGPSGLMRITVQAHVTITKRDFNHTGMNSTPVPELSIAQTEIATMMSEKAKDDSPALEAKHSTTCRHDQYGTSSLSVSNTSTSDSSILPSISSSDRSIIATNTSTSTCTRTCTVGETLMFVSMTTATYTVLTSIDTQKLSKRSDPNEGTVTETGYRLTTDLDGRVTSNEVITVKETRCPGGCPTTIIPGVSTVTRWLTASGPTSTLVVRTVQAFVTSTLAKRETLYTSSDTSAVAKTMSSASTVVEQVHMTSSIPSIQSGFITTTRWTELAHTTDPSGKTSDVLAVYVSTVTLDSAPTSTSASTEETSGIKYSLSSSEVVVRGHISLFEYFLAIFGAPVLFMAIRALTEPIVASLKLIEPFQKLSDLKSGTLSTPLSTQYLSSSLSIQSLKQLRDGHLIAFWSILMHVVLTLATPLASAAMTVRARSMCIVDGWVPCNPGWIINMPMMRSVEALIVICCVLSIMIIVITRRFYLRCLNPSSIISIACLMNQKDFINEIQKLDCDLNDNEYNCMLSFLPVRLRKHGDASSERYGFVLDSALNDIKVSAKFEDRTRSRISYSIVPSTKPARRMFSSLKIAPDLIRDIIHLLSSLSLLSLVLAYYLNNRDDIFNAFFNSAKWPPRMLLVGLATLSDVLMKDLERVVRITEPYRRLTLQTSPETTILMPLSGTCWSNLPRCLYYLCSCRHSQMGWQTIVSIVAILSEINVIVVAGVPYSESMTHVQYLVCVYAAVGITGSIIMVILIKIFWWLRTIKEMPRRPDTIGSVCGYLCGSRLIQWVSELELGEMSEEERRRIVRSSGQSFRFARGIGTDGVLRWTVDIA